MSDLHTRLADIVARSGRTQREISRQAGLSAGTLNEILNNPDRSPSVKSVQAIANTLGVSPSWLIDGTVDNQGPRGFAESDAAPWTPAKSGKNKHLSETKLTEIMAVLAPGSRTPSMMRINLDMPGFSLEAGDIAIIDLNATAQSGDIVVANVVDLGTGSGNTVLRRYLPPYLVHANSSRSDTTIVVDGSRTVIMGPVVASFRAPQVSD